MHEVSAVWQQIYAQPDHRKEIAVTVNGVEYYENRILNTAPSVSGKLFDAPSVGNARSRTLTLNLMPYDGPQGHISPMTEIRLYVRLKSADGQSVSEWIPKGVFYADEVKRDSDTGATRITAFDAIMKMERQFGNAVCRITFDDGFKGIQRFIRQIGDAMPTPDTPTHEGERFSAWYPNPADTETVVRDMLFTAEWARKFTVTFDSGSGTPQTFSVFSGDATPTPTTPTKEGYTFTGWTPTPAATVTADALYFAQWEAVTLQSVTITAYPAKTSYVVGDTLDYTGLVVTASYSDSTTQDVTAECVLSPADGTTVATSGTIAVTVAYGGETVGTFNVTVEEVTVQSLEIYGYSPFRWGYLIGDTLDYTGLEVYAVMPDETSINVTSVCTLSPAEGTRVSGAERTGKNGYDLDTGFITLTASYGGKTATTELEVADGGWWSLDNAGLLDIHCVGDMPPSIETEPSYNTYPWSLPYIYDADWDVVKQIYIRDGVTSIGDYAFDYCSGLTSVAIPSGVVTIGDSAFDGCSSLTSVMIPSSVTTIGDSAFAGCRSLTSVVIPDSVTNIDGEVFAGCASLISATLPANSSYVAFGMFSGCSNLTNISIPNSVTVIGASAFGSCTSLASINIPNGVTIIGSWAFSRCTALTNINIPDSVIQIGDGGNLSSQYENNVFNGCSSLESITLPNQLAAIGYGTFKDCVNLASIVIPDSVTTIGSYAFSGCIRLHSVTLPNQNVDLANTSNTFRGTALENVIIPDGFNYLANYMFDSCHNLTYVVIPRSVSGAGRYVFRNCENLRDIYYAGTGNEWNRISRGADIPYDITIHYNSSGPS